MSALSRAPSKERWPTIISPGYAFAYNDSGIIGQNSRRTNSLPLAARSVSEPEPNGSKGLELITSAYESSTHFTQRRINLLPASVEFDRSRPNVAKVRNLRTPGQANDPTGTIFVPLFQKIDFRTTLNGDLRTTSAQRLVILS
jgi:hypothetical protein